MANIYPDQLGQIDLKGLLDLTKKEIKFEINCVKIGKIKRFNASVNTADIDIVFGEQDFSTLKTVSYPTLTNVPVFTLQGGGASITFPIKAGDDCLLLFNDVDFTKWWNSPSLPFGLSLLASDLPPSPRRHDLSDAIALVGVKNRMGSGSVALDAVTIDAGLSRLDIKNTITSLKELLSDIQSALQQMNAIVTTLSTTVIPTPTPSNLAALATASDPTYPDKVLELIASILAAQIKIGALLK